MSREHINSMENVVTEEDQSSEFMYQIIQHTLQALSKTPAFDDKTLRLIKELAEASGLTNDQQVVEALSAGQRE